MRNIKISVTQDAIAYAREHLWKERHSDVPCCVRGMLQDQATGESYALMLSPWSGMYYAGRDGQHVHPLDKGTVEARIALARIGAQGGKAGKGGSRPAVSAANKERWAKRQDKKGGGG